MKWWSNVLARQSLERQLKTLRVLPERVDVAVEMFVRLDPRTAEELIDATFKLARAAIGGDPIAGAAKAWSVVGNVAMASLANATKHDCDAQLAELLTIIDGKGEF